MNEKLAVTVFTFMDLHHALYIFKVNLITTQATTF